MFFDISVINGTAVVPVPMTATRWALTSIAVCGQRAVCQLAPAKFSRPGMFGMKGSDKPPMTVMMKRAHSWLPSAAVISQSRRVGS